jgi:hypothetical protein
VELKQELRALDDARMGDAKRHERVLEARAAHAGARVALRKLGRALERARSVLRALERGRPEVSSSS